MDGGREGGKEGWKEGWMDGWMNGWIDGWTGGWMDGWMNSNRNLFLQISEYYLWNSWKLLPFLLVYLSMNYFCVRSLRIYKQNLSRILFRQSSF